MAIFKGAGVAIVTPMTVDGEVNYEVLGEMLEAQIEGGTDAIIICGTTGESATLSEEEHSAVIRYAIKKVNKRIPVIAGTGSNCTATAIKLSKEAEKDGADGLLLVTPYYNKATQKGLIAHYTAIAKAVSLPIILYNVPSRTGCNLQPETIAALVKNVKNIVGVKEASGNISQIAKVKLLCGDDIDLYSGNDDQVVPILSLGGIGVISVLSNVAPKETAIENVGNIEVAKLEKGLTVMATISGGAPMLGFLGTVTGMVRAFYEMANAGSGNIDITLLSGGIYEAMITTVGGLIVGIIAMFAYNYLVMLVDRVVNKMESRTMEFMDLLNEPAGK